MNKTVYDELEIRRDHRSLGNHPIAMAQPRFLEDHHCRFAMSIIERWAMVAAKPDGEDSAGRAKIALSDVGDIVNRACDIAALAFLEFEHRGWLTPCPTVAEMEEILKERENEREN